MTEFAITGSRRGLTMEIVWRDGEFQPPALAGIVLAWSSPSVAMTPTGAFIDRDLTDAESAWWTVASVFDVVLEASGYLPPEPPRVPDGAVA
jgi:hypothetical protein